MADNEESEMIGELGQTLRLALGSSLQVQEAHQRRLDTAQRASQAESATTAAEAADRHRVEAAAARDVNTELYRREFWRTASAQSVADHVTVAAHLSPRHPEARTAWMHAADLLRNDYGINLEDINRDHPGSLVQRHAALRDAMDDYVARLRSDAEAATVDGPNERPLAGDREAVAANVGDALKKQEEIVNAETEQITTVLPTEERDTGQDNTENVEATTQTEADTAREEAQAEPDAGGATEDRDALRGSEAAHLREASEAGDLAELDRRNADTEAQTGGREARMTPEQLRQIEIAANNPEHAQVRQRQVASFPEKAGSTPHAGVVQLERAKAATRGQVRSKTQNAELNR